MQSLLYVSTRRFVSTLDMHDILAVARSRNAALNVTGALVATPTQYAQLLEGPEAALDQLLASIRLDPRHADMRIVHRPRTARRELPKWSLAYCGDSSYVSRLVNAAISAPDFELESQLDAVHALMLMLA